MDRLATGAEAPSVPPAPLLTQLPLYATLFAACSIAAGLLISVPGLGRWYLVQQDQWLLIVGALLLILCLRGLPERPDRFDASWRLALAAGSAMALVAVAGHYWILAGYDLSADEQLANFDAAIRAKGQFAAPLSAWWQDHSDALNTTFMYRTPHREAWVSGYLPVNAALRALFGLIGMSALTGPLLSLLGALALWGCARRLWPENREAAVVALLLYAGAGQIWLNGMTAYAMPGHLAINLCWLWLVLRRNWWADAGALVLGFLATGLHQIHYHPLFAAPILFLLILRKEWARAAFYLVGYLAIGMFWQAWSYWVAMAGVGGALPAGAPAVDLLTRTLGHLETLGGLRSGNMTANLFRLVAWQHLLLLPLFLLGIRAARRDPIAAALVGGILLTLLVRIVAQPFQGHGLGYRYTHGLIGNFILVAVYGWMSLGPVLDRWRPLLLRTTAASCLVLLPMQAWMSHAFYGAYAEVSRRIDAAPADYVTIGIDDAPYSLDLVRNTPYLDTTPIRLVRERIGLDLGTKLCAAHPAVALVGPAALRPVTRYFNAPPSLTAGAENHKLAARLQREGCRIVTP